MTDEKVLSELERLEKEAPRSPWVGGMANGRDTLWFDIEDADENEILHAEPLPSREFLIPREWPVVEQEKARAIGLVEFVAALRNNASSLIADSRRLQQALDVLHQIQWGNAEMDEDDNSIIYELCPMCDQSKVRGHSPDCLVGMVLEDCAAGSVEPAQEER